MASLLDKKIVNDDRKFSVMLIILLMFVVWFFSNLERRDIQIKMICNSVRYYYAKITNDNSYSEYIYHRNKAVYLAKLNSPRRVKHAIIEMDKAVAVVPDYVSESVLKGLYRDRAYIKLYAGDKKGALHDFLLSGELNLTDDLKVAILLTECEAYGMAVKYCNEILKENNTAVTGYVCLSHVYEQAGKPASALKIYNYAIENKKPGNPKLYVERALLKKRINDLNGYDEDITLAKGLSPNINVECSLMEEAINPKWLLLSVQ